MTHLLKNNAWLVFAAVAFFALLGQRGLNEPDEGRYAEIAREMATDRDWLVPHMNGLPHYQKPPVIYWLTASSFRVFGEHEWSARLPSALSALGIVILVFLLARRVFGDRQRAVMAALVVTSCGGFFAMSRLLTPDMTMTFWITAAVVAAVYRRRWLFFVLMGIGFLTKGPMALVVPVSAVIGWELAAADDEKLHLPWVRGLALTLAISLSWFVVLSLRDHPLADYFWRYELVERFGSKTHGRSRPFWFFLMVLPIALIPWIFFVPFQRAWRRVRTWQFAPWQGLAAGWILVPLAILSLSGSKLPTYIIPLIPAFAILVAAGALGVGRAWKIAAATIVVLLGGDSWVSQHNDLLGVQASSRELVEILHEEEPDADEAILFACETRKEGLACYAQHLLDVTRPESDLVGDPTPSERTHLFASAQDCATKLTDGEPAHGIVRTSRLEQVFDPQKWRVIATSGAFSLVANHPPHGQAKTGG